MLSIRVLHGKMDFASIRQQLYCAISPNLRMYPRASVFYNIMT
jgi:hypothetical protein